MPPQVRQWQLGPQFVAKSGLESLGAQQQHYGRRAYRTQGGTGGGAAACRERVPPSKLGMDSSVYSGAHMRMLTHM